MDKIKTLKELAGTLSLHNTKNKLEELIHQAEQEQLSYLAFLELIFKGEIKYRHQKALDKRIKDAGFPYPTWIDGIYNLVLAGPPGVGKTHLAIALGYHACEEGYKVSYTTMQYLVQCLKTEEIDRRSRAKMNRIRKANLLIIDEVGYLPISAVEGNLFFQLISELQEQTSIIITTNKGFEEWTEFLNDPALASAILDRLSFRCDRIRISGKSYRLENRRSFLNDREVQDEV